ncbi:hypothetical protein GCM10011316_06170 [Roseibium aquae]|uniref:Tetratricopeptide repeat protein n=1 Tax=Roseibium aquae TaxID=1323746 RepID=A0A916T9N6_9HYPH|nr:tetratricopeptide repeat protein [Roseibium aquae]GGB36797.1 hypothetical protein GCM10011316_06170 [Roseibium aquae]
MLNVSVVAAFWRKRAVLAGLVVWAAALCWTLDPALSKPDGKDALFAALKASKTEMEARQIEAQIWEGWIGAAPAPDLEASVRGAMTKRRFGDYEGALADLEAVVKIAPGYAEAWNQRAFLLYLKGDMDGALQAIDRVLDIEPRHFGAMSGKFRVLIAQGRARLAQKVLKQAVDIHPFLQERVYLEQAPDTKGIEL